MAPVKTTSVPSNLDPDSQIAKHEAIIPSRALIVAGFTAAGKSTFIDELQQQRLSPRLSEQLPSGCDQWRLVASSRLGHRNTIESDEPLIIHLDLLRSLRQGARRLDEDLFLEKIMTESEVTVVNLIVSRYELLARLKARSKERDKNRSPLYSLRNHMNRPIRRLAYRNGFAPMPHTIDLYSYFTEKYEDLTDEWLEMLKRIGSVNEDFRAIFLRPFDSTTPESRQVGWRSWEQFDAF